MANRGKINETWLKAAVLGSLWAASEIVLGSFLHNLSFPFAGSVLTLFAILLLVSVSQVWKDKGLFWRTGLICAALKSLSPGAVIFGPMLSIVAESFLMEFAVLIFKRTIFAYVLAGVLAMLWNVFYPALKFLIVYGFNFVPIYERMLKATHLENELLRYPIILFSGLFAFLGAIVAIVAILSGRRALRYPEKRINLSVEQVKQIKSNKSNPIFPHSVIWLVMDFISLVSVYILIAYSSNIIWIPVVIAISIIWIVRYKTAIKRLAKPKFWVFFIFITLLTVFIFYGFGRPNEDPFGALIVAIEMNLQAAYTIFGFASLACELRNPVVAYFFSRNISSQFPPALQLAFDSLPSAISNLPSVKDIFRRPGSIIHNFITQAGNMLTDAKLTANANAPVFIVTANEKQGKSSFLADVVNCLVVNQIKAGGFVSPAVFDGNEHVGYDLINVTTNQRMVLSRTMGSQTMPRVGKYFFCEETILFTKQSMRIDNISKTDCVVVDEIGPWEIKDQGWSDCITKLVLEYSKPMIFVVRESIVDKVISKWKIKNAHIYSISETKANLLCKEILNVLSK